MGTGSGQLCVGQHIAAAAFVLAYQGGPAAVAGLDMTVDGVVCEVGLAADEPPEVPSRSSGCSGSHSSTWSQCRCQGRVAAACAQNRSGSSLAARTKAPTFGLIVSIGIPSGVSIPR